LTLSPEKSVSLRSITAFAGIWAGVELRTALNAVAETVRDHALLTPLETLDRSV